MRASDQVVPDPPNDNPEQPIGSTQLGARPFAFVNGKLLAKSGRLHCQTVPRYQKCPHVRQHGQYKCNHHSDATQQSFYSLGEIPKLLISEVADVLMTDTIGFEQPYLRPTHISSVPTFSSNIVAL